MPRTLARWTAVTLLLAAAPLAAAEMVPLRDAATGRVFSLSLAGYRASAGTAKSALSTADVAAQALAFATAQAEVLGISGEQRDLVALPAEVDKLGLGHQRFALRYGGLPVYGGEVYVHVDPVAGVYYATVKGMGEAPATLVPTLTADDARQVAIIQASETIALQAPIAAESPELLIFPMRLAGGKAANGTRLAWQVRVAVDDPMELDEQCFVDAENGAVLISLSNNRYLDRRVYDCAKWPGTPGCYIDSHLSGYYYGRSETAPPRGPYPRSDYPFYFGSTEVDTMHALFGINHQYLLSRFDRDGANDEGGLSKSPRTTTIGYVHGDNASPQNCPRNAWYGSSTSAVAFCRSMVTPDLLGHEYSHGTVLFMFRDANDDPLGTVFQGETGSLEESFCDIQAEGVELAATGAHDWHFGLWFDIPPGTYPSCSYGLFRDLADPNNDVDERYGGLHYPDRSGSANVYCGTEDSAGAHHNSTIPSYAFYLLSEGGTCNGCTISPIGLDAALQVWYRAWTTYFTRTVTFNEAFFALQQAAADLYPQEVVDQVRIALQAVEMDQPGACSGLPAQTPACAGASAVPNETATTAASATIRFCGPNPSLGAATIEYALARSGQVDVAVFDVAGRRVATIVAERQERGLHQVTWRDRQVPSGHYLVRLSVDGQAAATRKLMVIR